VHIIDLEGAILVRKALGQALRANHKGSEEKSHFRSRLRANWPSESDAAVQGERRSETQIHAIQVAARHLRHGKRSDLGATLLALREDAPFPIGQGRKLESAIFRRDGLDVLRNKLPDSRHLYGDVRRRISP